VSITESKTDGFDDDEPLVSVIVPSKNSEGTIAACLGSIYSQTYTRIEVIVVDGFSTDLTREIARKAGAHVVLVHDERSSAKNLGAKFATGLYLYFLDADCKLDSNAIATSVEAIQGVDGVLTQNRDIIGSSRVSRLISARRIILSNDPLNVSLRFVRKEVFRRLGGFDVDLYVGEDLDFQRRFLLYGFNMGYSRAKEWHLGSPADLRKLLNRSLYYSTNYTTYASKNPLNAIRRLNPIREIAACKKSDAHSSDLLPVLMIGLLSIVFLVMGVLSNLAKVQHVSDETLGKSKEKNQAIVEPMQN
jgi:glycosyltransferase involved in cell wall biosynthesis